MKTGRMTGGKFAGTVFYDSFAAFRQAGRGIHRVDVPVRKPAGVSSFLCGRRAGRPADVQCVGGGSVVALAGGNGMGAVSRDEGRGDDAV